MTYTLFETLEDLIYHLRNGYAVVEAQRDLSDQNIVHITISGKPIYHVSYRRATLEGEEDQMIAVDNSDLLIVEQIENRLNFLKMITGSRNVKDINITPTSVIFTYKDRYAIELFPRSINNLLIRDSETSQFEFATLNHFSRIFEILDKNLKEFAK